MRSRRVGTSLLVFQPDRKRRVLGLDDFNDGLARERRPAGEHAVNHAPQCIDVATAVAVLGIPGLFQGHVPGGADGMACLGQVHFFFHRLDHAQVGNFHLAVPADQHVVGLDVPVYQAVVVSVFERTGAGQGDMDGVSHGKPAQLIQPGLEALAADVLHREEMTALVLAYAVALDEVGVVKAAGEPRSR